MGFLLTPAGTAFLPAMATLVNRSPGAAFGFFAADTTLFVTFLNVFGLAFLFACIAGFVASWHKTISFLGFVSAKKMPSTILSGRR
jgi:hypothetical protein